MAAGQALSLPRFVRAMTAYAVSRPDRVARVVIVAEALAAVLLLPPATRLAGAVLGLLVALTWTFFAARALAQAGALAGVLAAVMFELADFSGPL